MPKRNDIGSPENRHIDLPIKKDGININILAALAFAAGTVGWFIMAAVQSLVMINYLTTGRLLWLTDLFASGPIIFVSSSSLAFLTLGFFYLTFARQQSLSFSD